jgi:hypothetical protein
MNEVNLAVPVASIHKRNSPYTAAGLGDRIHLLTVAWAYATKMRCSVVMHISGNGVNELKLKSFQEILDLFPEGNIGIVFHDYVGTDNKKWIMYLREKGINAKTFYYGDYLGRFGKKFGIDISPFLRDFPKIKIPQAKMQTNDLNKRYVTVQWDSTAPTRTLPKQKQLLVLSKYQQQGYTSITIGGESEDFELRTSLSAAALAISRADLHVGVDSGFMHLAFLYLDFSRIHLYVDSKGFWAHHLFRAFKNGCICNYHYLKPNKIEKLRIKLLYNSKVLNYLIFSRPKVLDWLRNKSNFLNRFRARSLD